MSRLRGKIEGISDVGGVVAGEEVVLAVGVGDEQAEVFEGGAGGLLLGFFFWRWPSRG